MTRPLMQFLTLVLAAFAALPSAGAQAPRRAPEADGPSLVMHASNTTAAAAAARGVARTDSAARPGDVLRYAMVFTNTTADALRGVTLDNPLPRGLEYVAGTARATRTDAGARFSADGGRTYARQPMETVVVNGEQVTRPIAAERYTHVRWVVSGAVAPGATVTAEYSVRVTDGRRAAGTPGNDAPQRR